MSTGTPYIGSQISLVSKAKIRYEGTLFSIDAENATVALSKVRSFGTEDRKTDNVVQPRDDLYEYIIFRGSDIEDLTVCEPPKPQQPPAPLLPPDPAIVQSAVTSQHSGLPPQPPLMPPHYMPSYYGMPPYGMMPPPHHMPHPPQVGQSPRPPPPPPVQQNSHGAAHKSPSPSSLGRVSPTSDQGIQTGSPMVKASESQKNERRTTANHQDQAVNKDNSRVPNDYRAHQHQRNSSWRGRNDGRGDYHQRGNRRGSRGRSSRGRYNGPRKDDVLNFEGDFDFESSNAQFNKEDIAKELMDKLKISGKKDSVEKVKGEEGGEKIDSGIDSAHTNETAEDSDDSEEQPIYYDKAKSFFDNITCETNNPRGERMSWSDERKLNTETFGSAWRGGRGRGYRGRGGGYYRGRGGGYYRGGGQRNYGGYNNYRNDNRNYGGGGYNRGYNNNRGGYNNNRSWNDRTGDNGHSNWRPHGGRGRQYENRRPQSEQDNKTARSRGAGNT